MADSSKENTDWWAEIDALVDGQADLMSVVRRHLHAHPEVSGQEFETTRYVGSVLSERGLNVRVPSMNRGVLVEPTENGAPPNIGVRADMDALWIQDAKNADYKSGVDGIMHACGHDGHTATVLGVVLALAAAEKERLLPWPVRWRGIFQPSEETNRGALEMMDAGALVGLEAMLSLHMDSSRPVGTIGILPGVMTANCDRLDFVLHGVGGHAARPHETIDPVAAAAQLIASLYQNIPRRVNVHQPVVFSIGQIEAGHSFNVIPDKVVMSGTLRSFDKAVREQTLDQIRRTANGIAAATGVTIDIIPESGPPAVVNNEALTALIASNGAHLLGPENTQTLPHPSLGGEDFANYQKKVPCCIFRVGCADSPEGGPPLHSPHFDLNERAMTIGAKILVRSMIDWSKPTNLEQKP